MSLGVEAWMKGDFGRDETERQPTLMVPLTLFAS
jgi:hypothetical protein